MPVRLPVHHHGNGVRPGLSFGLEDYGQRPDQLGASAGGGHAARRRLHVGCWPAVDYTARMGAPDPPGSEPHGPLACRRHDNGGYLRPGDDEDLDFQVRVTHWSLASQRTARRRGMQTGMVAVSRVICEIACVLIADDWRPGRAKHGADCR